MANQIMPNIEDFVDSAPLLDSPGELRIRAAEQGYLFFRSLLDTASVLELRRQILAVCHKHGWLAPDTPLMEGVSRKDSLFIEGNSPEWSAFYTDVQRLRAFNALALLNESRQRIAELEARVEALEAEATSREEETS